MGGARTDGIWPSAPANPNGPEFNPTSIRGPNDPGALASGPTPRLSSLEKKSGGNRVYFLIAAVIIAFLVVGLLFMSIWRKPDTVALQTPEAKDGVPATEAKGQKDEAFPAKTERIALDFVQDQEIHHYRDNKTAGKVLIITGQIKNGYPEPRSFIRIKGSLMNERDEVVAERQVFAGNYLTEEEIVNLPMPEILARLALKGGQDNANVNVPPRKNVHFMLVFDRLPEDLAAYILEPVGSVPADQDRGGS
jgi:hypothetical protein